MRPSINGQQVRQQCYSRASLHCSNSSRMVSSSLAIENKDSRTDALTSLVRSFAPDSNGFSGENLFEPNAGAVGRTSAANPFEYVLRCCGPQRTGDLGLRAESRGPPRADDLASRRRRSSKPRCRCTSTASAADRSAVRHRLLRALRPAVFVVAGAGRRDRRHRCPQRR